MMTKKISFILVFFIILPGLLRANGADKQTEISFYSEIIEVHYHSSLVPDGLLIPDDLSLIAYFEQMEARPYRALLDQLEHFRKEYRLNDWLYYQLLQRATAKIYEREGPLKEKASLWFLLTKSGFDTRLSYLDNQLFLYVWAEEDIFETPMISDEGRRFINLSSINKAENSLVQLKLLLYRPGAQEGRPFNFSLSELPALRPRVGTRSLSFKVEERTFNMEIEIDKTLFEIMKNYPSLAESAYFQIPMSETAHNSLIPRLKFMVKGLSRREALQTLVSFTRTAFNYKDDQETFGRSRPMIAEELLHYPFSDCEDRCALFYYLVKEILELPMIIIAYPDHLTIAVAEEEIGGLAIEFEGQRYFICDPTGPKESNRIGMPPIGYESVPFEILKRP